MSDIKEISKREFIRNASKYINAGGRYLLIGRDFKSVIQIGVSDKDMSDKGKVSDNLIKAEYRHKESLMTYGCGCVREEGKSLCGRHKRI